MRQKVKQLIGILLSVAMMLGMMLGMSLTAYADNTDSDDVTNYPLWVSGTQVTSLNAADPGSRGWSYTPATDSAPATLTLNGYNYKGTEEKYKAGIYAEQDLTISLTGTNVVESTAGDGINVQNASLTITGTGVLNATSSYSKGCGIRANVGVTINGCEVNATGDGCGINSLGVYDSISFEFVGGNVTISGNSKVNAFGNGDSGCGICSNAGVTIDGSEVTATGNLNGIYCNGTLHSPTFRYVGSVAISGDAKVTASGKGEISCGINANDTVTIDSGEVTAIGTNVCISGSNGITINGGTVTAIGTAETTPNQGISSGNGIVTIAGGTVSAKGTTEGIYAQNGVTISGGTVIASGANDAIGTNHVIGGKFKNTIAGVGWTDVDGTTGEADIAISTEGQTLYDYKKVRFPAVWEATVTTAPKAKSLKYTGSAQKLVKAGTADGGTMYYALGTATEATKQYTTSIPEAVGAGTYYIWYKVVGDKRRTDTEPKMVTASIARQALTITAKDQTYPYNGNIQGEGDTVYTEVGQIKEKVDVKGLVGNDALTSIILDGQANDIGVYNNCIMPSSAAIGDHTANYDITYISGTLTIKSPYSWEWVKGKWYEKDGSQTYEPTGSWKKDGTDWMYVDDSGWCAKNRWQKIDGKWYFFDRKGHMVKDVYQKGVTGRIWYVTKNGIWDGNDALIGWKKDANGWWFALYGNDYLKSTWKMINGDWYYFKANGYIAMNEFVQGYWINENGTWKDKVLYSWHKSGGKWWYGVEGGWYAKNGSYIIDGKEYTFDKKGYCVNP